MFKPHMHRCFCIGAVDQGDVFYQVAGPSVHLKPGALTLINPETLHSCTPQTLAASSYFMLYLQTDWCLKVSSRYGKPIPFDRLIRPSWQWTDRLYGLVRAQTENVSAPE
ncbi:MAG: hypothetical protein HF981_22495 [Desulfobacteraceae bacterium]|nr:hypothetical protein [Desulfobacteraceae bacterium]MBC2753184.1 AraC family ligand binding domain-containing protein [Desulfobacteraceae bacterium]